MTLVALHQNSQTSTQTYLFRFRSSPAIEKHGSLSHAPVSPINSASRVYPTSNSGSSSSSLLPYSEPSPLLTWARAVALFVSLLPSCPNYCLFYIERLKGISVFDLDENSQVLSVTLWMNVRSSSWLTSMPPNKVLASLFGIFPMHLHTPVSLVFLFIYSMYGVISVCTLVFLCSLLIIVILLIFKITSLLFIFQL